MGKYFKETYSAIIILVVTLFLYGNCHADTVYTHHQTDIIFPSEISLLKFNKITNYEKQDKGLGIGVSYRSELGLKADIYLYNLGIKNIPSGISSKIVKNAYKNSLNDIQTMGTKGYYQNVHKLNDSITYDFSIPFLLAKYSYLDLIIPESKRVECISYIYMTGYRGYILKIRFTYLNDLPDQGEEIHNMFMNSFMKLIK